MLLYQVVLTWLNASLQHGSVPTAPGSGCVLNRPARNINGAAATVEQLDEIVAESRS
jgi:hypothetical protein